ncbi:hypothetical protein AB0C52_24385 [Streptomyces sp. NPDC048717]|uniref:hypothetical protein n=1 Tax=Streptomyces sp. NPDC048717 TaxID=3154928 RepID=UPI0034159E2B
MTSDSAPPFVAAPPGWRLAFADPEERDITVAPIVGWQPLPAGAPSCLVESVVEPVVLWDNVGEPFISPALEFIEGNPQISVHQVLAPGFEVRDLPSGWKIIEYGDQ